MCTMGNILCFILLICAVTNCFGSKEEKESSLNETEEYDETTEVNFEEEAKIDIYNLLQNMISVNKNDSKTHNKTSPKIIIEHNETLVDRLDDVLKQLGIKRRRIDRDTATVVDENVRLDDQFEWDKEDLSFNARHRDLMKNLASKHSNVVKKRMVTIEKDALEDQSRNEGIAKLMKSLDSNHMNAVKSRVNGDNVIHRSVLTSDYINQVMQVAKNLQVRPVVHPGAALSINKYEGKGKPLKEDVNFIDLISTEANKNNETNITPNYRASDIIQGTSNVLNIGRNDQIHQVEKPDIIQTTARIDMRFIDMLHSKNMGFVPPVKNMDFKETGNDMGATTLSHLSNINMNQFNPMDQNLNSKYTNGIIKTANVMNTNNKLLNNKFVQNYDMKYGDQSKVTGNYIKSTDKFDTEYNDQSDLLYNKMYAKHLEKSKVIGKNVMRLNDMLTENTKNESYDIMKHLDVNNRYVSTVNASNFNIINQKSDMLNANNYGPEYRPVEDINVYMNGNYTIEAGNSMPNDENELLYRPVKDIDVYMAEQNNHTANETAISGDMINSDSNYHLRLLMKNLGISDSHDKQKIVPNIKTTTDRFQKPGKKTPKTTPSNSTLDGDDDDNKFIAEVLYRPQQSLNSFNNAPLPALLNMARPVYQRLRTSPKPRLVSEEKHGSRFKRSTFTQAGYTQDPDTCKTYNENLVKLWSNLSKLINVTEQPNERALHNIAMMIQAYLEHQNGKSTTESSKVKHEGTRDKPTEVIQRIKKLLEENDGSAEKITKIITKHLKPFYGDVENADCQQVNEESLGSSVELLYKNYLNHAECHNEGDAILRNKQNLRQRTPKNLKGLSNNWQSPNNEYKPEVKTILTEDELYEDFHRGKMPRERPNNKFRRNNRRNMKVNSLSYRSGDRNDKDGEKPKARTKVIQKSSNQKMKKSTLKSDDGKCEKYAIRKFTASLRPVMDRYMALLECQLDNTLRSRNYNRVSRDPYYLYASKFYSNEDGLRQKKLLRNTKLTRKNTERSRNNSPRKRETINRYDTTDAPIFVRTAKTNYPHLRKYSLKDITGMNSPSSVPKKRTKFKELNTNTNNQDHTKYNGYFESPPLYDDYDGIYRTDSTNQSGSLPLINPLKSVNDNVHTGDKGIKKITVPLVSEKSKDVRYNNHDIFYVDIDDFPEEPIPTFDLSDDEETNPSVTEVPGFIDLTKLRENNEVTAARVQTQSTLKSYESITDFLKNARDASLKTPEFAVPFALDSNKGYVELTHLIKYPKVIVYRPQFIVKNTMPYDDFLKTINNINMTNEEVRLMKIVRHLPDNTVKVLFETEDFESPLEVRNVNDYRRTASLVTSVESETSKKSAKYDDTDILDYESGERFSAYGDEVPSSIMDSFIQSVASASDENDLQYDLNSNPVFNSTVNLASNTTFNSNASSVLMPRLASGLTPNIGTEFLPESSDLFPGLDTATDADIGKDLSLGSALKLSSILPSKLSSYFTKFFPSYSNSQTKSLLNVNEHTDSQSQIISNSESYSNSLSQSASNSFSNQNQHTSSTSDSIPPSVSSRLPEFENAYPSTTESIVSPWWDRWKNILKGKIKKLIRKMAKLAENIDHLIKL